MEKEIVSVNVKMTKKELDEFDEAIKKCKKFLNRSDAIRQLIRDFIESVKDDDKQKEAEVTA